MWLQLDILAGNIRRGNLTGKVLVNGRPMQPSHFRKLNCYILQRDVLLATATVGFEADKAKACFAQACSRSRWVLPGALAACTTHMLCSTCGPHNGSWVADRGGSTQSLLCPFLCIWLCMTFRCGKRSSRQRS